MAGPITTGETGPDWEPVTDANRYFAQDEDSGAFAFGPTEEAARAKLATAPDYAGRVSS